MKKDISFDQLVFVRYPSKMYDNISILLELNHVNNVNNIKVMFEKYDNAFTLN